MFWDQASAARHRLFEKLLELNVFGKDSLKKIVEDATKLHVKSVHESRLQNGMPCLAVDFDLKTIQEKHQLRDAVLSDDIAFLLNNALEKRGITEELAVDNTSFSISMQQVFCLPHSWQIIRQRNSKNFPGIYMKTSICQPRLERGNHSWPSGMRSANWVRAVRGRFYSSPRTDLWVSISSAGSSHMHNHRYQRCPGTSSYKDLFWCIHPMTDSREYTLKIAKLFCMNWRSCRMTWF